jgi:signal transduction histidine kinase
MEEPRPSSREPKGARDLHRLRWIGLLLPVAFVWAFEILRFLILDQAYSGDTAHLIAATLMAGAVVVFAVGMAYFLDRAQRQLVAQNKDLTVTHAVSSAVRGGLSLPELVAEALEQLVEQTGALAAVVRVHGPDPDLVISRPADLSEGMAWVRPILDEVAAGPGPAEPTFAVRHAVDTGLLDLPLVRGGDRVGRLRLVFHPPIEPDLSSGALADIAGEIATSIQLARVVADLRRRERESAALYGLALQLTRRADLRETLDTITHDARELLAADHAVVCLSDGRPGGIPATPQDRVAMVDDGTVCTFAHTGEGHDHARNPTCPLHPVNGAVAWASRPMRGPDGHLGEVCVVRRAGAPFTDSERDLLAALADMAAIAVRTARLHDAEEQYTILAERDRIARELHDSLAQVLGVIHLRLRAVEPLAEASGSPGLIHEIDELAEVADEAYRDVREAILGLRETIGSETGLEGSLREYLHKFGRQTGIQASLVCQGTTRGALAPRTEVQLLRVVQEALTNVRKHAGAQRVVVRLDCDAVVPVLEVEDDGSGFDPAMVVASLEGGFGLASMRERVQQIGGTLDVHTGPGKGTRIVVRLEPEEDRVASAAAPASAPGR